MEKIIQKRIRFTEVEEIHLNSLKTHFHLKSDQELIRYLIETKIEEVTINKSSYFSQEITKTINSANQKMYREIKNSYNELFLISHVTFQTVLIKLLHEIYDVKLSVDEMDLLKQAAIDDLINHNFSNYIRDTVQKINEEIENI